MQFKGASDVGKLKDALSMIETAIGAINTKTVLKMVPRASETDYVKIVVDWTLGGGRSDVGRRGKAQSVLIDPAYNPPWALVHELAHAIGMIHEHRRPDRGAYVTIASGAPSSYSIDHAGVPIGSYDCHSTMAYLEDKYLKYVPGACSPTGHGLSTGDVEALAYVYRGSLGARFESYDWTSGWTTAFFYEVAGKPYMFFLKAGEGTAAISPVTPDGRIADEIFRQTWSTGWTTALFYEVAGKPYMFFLKAGDGTAAVSRVSADGRVGKEVFRQQWGKGWTTACFYEVAGEPYMFFLKKGDGTAAITQVFDDGTVGKDLERYHWSSGWTNALVYRLGSRPYMFLLKSSSGRVDLHEVGVGA